MIAFPNAKINIGLYIIGKRPDGYHDIESIFYPIPICDALEIVRADELKFTTSGLPIPGEVDQNLCLKAYHLMAQRYSSIEPIHIHLHKTIPMGAGLGGGSADGAFMINLLNDFFRLDIDREEREEMAAELGSDCPFFIENQPKFVSGRGEVMKTHPINLKGLFIGIISPPVHVSTKEAYASIQPAQNHFDWLRLNAGNVSQWSNYKLKNQFEAGVGERHPAITRAKNELRENGALYASMTGSGSSVYGLFSEKPSWDKSKGWLLEL